MKRYQAVFSALFLTGLFSLSALNLYRERAVLKTKIDGIARPKAASELKSYTRQLDGVLSQTLVGGHRWNELYGTVYRALGKNEENSFKYVRDKDSVLYAGNFYNTSNLSAPGIAGRMRRLQDSLKDKGTKLVVIMYPTKYREDWSRGYYGIPYNNFNAYGDEVLRYLRRYDVDYIDVRDVFREADMKATEIFYRTDHHWTVPSAFYATGKIVDHLNRKYDANLDPDGFYRDLNNYTIETYANIYMGRREEMRDRFYSGELDDYSFIFPKFDTQYHYYCRYRGGREGSAEGDMEQALISRKYLNKKDLYDREMNNGYIQGVVRFDQIDNKLNPDVRRRSLSEIPILLRLPPSFRRCSRALSYSGRCTITRAEKAVFRRCSSLSISTMSLWRLRWITSPTRERLSILKIRRRPKTVMKM